MTTSAREYREAILDLLPPQGDWSEEEYLWLTDHSNRLIEFTDGTIEVLPMPTEQHQAILQLFAFAFAAYIRPRGGVSFFAPLRLRLRGGKMREPDLLLLCDARDPRRQNRYWLGADLVLEVVSADEPARDLVTKRRDYADAGIPEYWIINPLTQTITVLTLRDGQYVEHGVFARGQRATSALLPDFAVDVAEVFAA
jgi:Uma2 family endonuclease